jgi:ubiquinone/menaquinone biosynthesis C-methylase UbiE
MLLDVACGSGGPTLRIAQVTGCTVVGVDLHTDAIDTAVATSAERKLAARAQFRTADASEPLPFADGQFDGLICIDAINHLKQREGVFGEWYRALKPGGRLVFTDPITVTGLLTSDEMRIRSSIGYFLFAARGEDMRLLKKAGFEVTAEEDRTENMARMAERWRHARQAREAAVRQAEGDQAFEGQQQFFRVAARLAAEGRLSRFAYRAVKPGA